MGAHYSGQNVATLFVTTGKEAAKLKRSLNAAPSPFPSPATGEGCLPQSRHLLRAEQRRSLYQTPLARFGRGAGGEGR